MFKIIRWAVSLFRGAAEPHGSLAQNMAAELPNSGPYSPSNVPPHVSLESQLATLADVGLKLDDGITVDDLLYSFGRDEYEQIPFDLILFAFGIEVEREPWGRAFCSRVWNFDTECINDTGDYAEILTRISRVADAEFITNIEDFVDIENNIAWVSYEIDGKSRKLNAVVNDDWADFSIVSTIMREIERGGRKFFSKDNGQAMILFYLTPADAITINNKIVDERNYLKLTLT